MLDLHSDHCQWFALCDEPAITHRMGPVMLDEGGLEFKPIPICDRCARRVDEGTKEFD